MKNYGEEILQMVDICKVFDLGDGKKLHAAENVNVTIHKGETVGIVGESGSGKSTLAKMLTRLYSMTSGKIIFHGKDITDLKGEAPSAPQIHPDGLSGPLHCFQSEAARQGDHL